MTIQKIALTPLTAGLPDYDAAKRVAEIIGIWPVKITRQGPGSKVFSLEPSGTIRVAVYCGEGLAVLYDWPKPAPKTI